VYHGPGSTASTRSAIGERWSKRGNHFLTWERVEDDIAFFLNSQLQFRRWYPHRAFSEGAD